MSVFDDWLRAVPKGRVFLGEVLNFSFNHLAFPREKLSDRSSKTRIGDPMRTVGQDRQITALKFVRPLRAGFDSL
jgi:hypothetical protein